MFSVSVLAHRRADHLRYVLGALIGCDDVDKWRVRVVLDRPDVLTLDAAQRSSLAAWELVTLDAQNGHDAPYSRVSRATLSALALGFATSDYVVHLEQDCVPAEDFLTWHAQMAERYVNDQQVFSVNAWAGSLKVNHERDHLGPHFTPWGWGTWRDRFEEMRAAWDFDFWDRHLNERLRGERLGAFPAVSKVVNIGSGVGVTGAP